MWVKSFNTWVARCMATVLCLWSGIAFSQGLKRSVLCSVGGSSNSGGTYVSYSLGQPSNIGTVGGATGFIRQGFEQPIGCFGGPVEYAQGLSICDGSSVTVGSSVYSEEGIYTDTLLNAYGCDSVVTTTLDLNPVVESFDAVVSCEAFDWNGEAYSASGYYTYLTTDQNGCDSVATLDLTLSDLALEAELISPSCFDSEDGAIDLTYTSNAMPVVINWSNGLMFEDNLNIPAGEYSVTVTDSNDCSLSSSFELIGPQELYVSVDAMDASCIETLDGAIGLEVLGGTSPYQFSWSNGSDEEGLTNIGVGDYSVAVTDANDCEVMAEVTIDALEEDCLNIPDVFTPNGDLVNDDWIINGIGAYPSCSMQIYNRWGQLLYESEGYTTPWDGTYNGQELPMADYFFILDLDDGTEAITGTVTLVR